jgi:hypothetical protein
MKQDRDSLQRVSNILDHVERCFPFAEKVENVILEATQALRNAKTESEKERIWMQFLADYGFVNAELARVARQYERCWKV